MRGEVEIFFHGNRIQKGYVCATKISTAIILFLWRIIISGVCNNSLLEFDYSSGRQIDIHDCDG